jgi:hypothetical protein
LTARRDRADENAIANLVSGYTFAQVFDDPDGLVSDNKPRLYRILASKNMDIRAANRGQGNPDDCIACAR